MNNSSFQVSVIIPVYNAEGFLRKAVESALFHPEVKEVILIEDGSPDGSLEVCKEIVASFERTRLYQHEGGVNNGAGASRNLGIQKATQDFICFLDADDFMTDCRFEREKEVFSNNPEADGVYGAIGARYYDDIGAKAWEEMGFDESNLYTVNKYIFPEVLFEYLIGYKNSGGYSGCFHIDALTLRRKALVKQSIFFDESLRLHQDTFFIWKCAYYLKLFPGEIEVPLAIRGIHKDNRYIHHKNLRDSNSKLYKNLLQWSKEANLSKEYQDVFQANFYYLQLGNFGIIRSKIRFFCYFFLSTHFRKICIRGIYNNIYVKHIPEPLRLKISGLRNSIFTNARNQ